MLLSYQYLCIISKYYIILITILYNTDYDIISKYEKWNIKTDYENQRKQRSSLKSQLILYLSNNNNYLIIKIKLKYLLLS
jgi:hypothetical protein